MRQRPSKRASLGKRRFCLIPVGGLFDFYSGRIARAPMAFRRVGCEWVWRLAQEPQRLAHRYLVGNLTFMVRAWVASREAGAARQDATKRLFDVIGAGLILALAWPLVVLAMIAIRLDSRGPAFFRQVRVGENGRPFTMWKFRSMVADADARRADLLALSDRDATCFKMKGDPRVTRVGRFIRRCSIDELPQLFNVLRGEMSLVGPRPALPVEAVTYRNNDWARLKGKPGITCTWQVGGRAEISFEDQVELDIAYLRDHHLAGDIALLARTIPAVLVARGAY
jgi:lipopolysaccharide/colanic/teichoic acid biosynthesis glycosyltransferase